MCRDDKRKGVVNGIVRNQMPFGYYRDSLHKKHSMKTIISHNHKIKSYEITKCCLSCYDNNKHSLEDSKTTFAYGHKKIFPSSNF